MITEALALCLGIVLGILFMIVILTARRPRKGSKPPGKHVAVRRYGPSGRGYHEYDAQGRGFWE